MVECGTLVRPVPMPPQPSEDGICCSIRLTVLRIMTCNGLLVATNFLIARYFVYPHQTTMCVIQLYSRPRGTREKNEEITILSQTVA